MTRTETELRLDTLKRHLDEPTAGWEVARGIIVATGFLAFLALQLFLVLPSLVSVAGR